MGGTQEWCVWRVGLGVHARASLSVPKDGQSFDIYRRLIENSVLFGSKAEAVVHGHAHFPHMR